ncbi:MAG: hypothetical protein FWH52_05210 [Synergistaceae bacterium]|nr:hypothetical protein [Synergistaceae bacterium]
MGNANDGANDQYDLGAAALADCETALDRAIRNNPAQVFMLAVSVMNFKLCHFGTIPL